MSSGSVFDNLARALATPMPRRQALRAVGAAFAVAAFPTLRPDRAAASAVRVQECPSPTKRCFVAIKDGTHEGGCYYSDYAKCCVGPNNDSVHPNQMSWTCGKDEDCGSAKAGFCKCTNKCKDGKCCPKSKGRCVKGACCPAIRTTFAPGTNNKGAACCPPGTIAVPGGVGLCCPKGKAKCCDEFDSRVDTGELAPLGMGKGKLCVKGKVKKA